MRWSQWTAAALAALAASASASDVVKVTNDNFAALVANEPAFLVEFFAPCAWLRFFRPPIAHARTWRTPAHHHWGKKS